MVGNMDLGNYGSAGRLAPPRSSDKRNPHVGSGRGYTSLRRGTEDWAPGRVTEIAAALDAKEMASSTARPSQSAATNAPLNVSPAAVVATALPGTEGCIP